MGLRAVVCACLGVVLASSPARADGDNDEPPPAVRNGLPEVVVPPPVNPLKPGDVVVKISAPRTRANAITLSASALGGVGVFALAIRFNLDAQSNASIASNQQPDSGRMWSSTTRDAYNAAYTDSHVAEALYAAGGVLVIGSIVAYFVTAPPSTSVVIHPGRKRELPAVVPISHGAVMESVWRF